VHGDQMLAKLTLLFLIYQVWSFVTTQKGCIFQIWTFYFSHSLSNNPTVPSSRSCGRESTITKLKLCANYSKIPMCEWSESSGSEAEHGVTMDGMHDGEVPEWM